MSENNDFIQLPPLKKDTPADVVAFMWEYMKVPENKAPSDALLPVARCSL